MLGSSPDALFRHRPQLLEQAFELWRECRYAPVVKALYYSNDELSAQQADDLLRKLLEFRFSPEVIQHLGAAQSAQGAMFYDESFLNMLQRVNFRSLKFSRQEKSLNRKPLFSVKGSLLQVRLVEQILKAWLYDVSAIVEVE